ncbi:MAG: hypothetical protein IKR23_02635 [Lachnospiraceae bacterium]|nr:hypothetical protein [Lachnospiraceae bacterium]
MGQKLYDVITAGDGGAIHWAYNHEGLIIAGILLFVLIIVAILIVVLVKLIRNGEGKKEEAVPDPNGASADDQIGPKE